MALAFLPNGTITGPQPRSVLVLGGSSEVSASTIEILPVTRASVMLLTISSFRHHTYTASLGASKAFDQKSQTPVADIKAATPEANVST